MRAGVGDLVDREEQRAAARRVRAQRRRRRRGSVAGRGRRTARRPAAPAAATAGRQRAARACAALSTACRSASPSSGPRSSDSNQLASRSAAAAAEEPDREVERPADCLRGPRRDRVRKVEEDAVPRSLAASAWPWLWTDPALGGSTPARHSNSVVFPAPFGPIRPRTSPGRTENDTSLSATRRR